MKKHVACRNQKNKLMIMNENKKEKHKKIIPNKSQTFKKSHIVM